MDEWNLVTMVTSGVPNNSYFSKPTIEQAIASLSRAHLPYYHQIGECLLLDGFNYDCKMLKSSSSQLHNLYTMFKQPEQQPDVNYANCMLQIMQQYAPITDYILHGTFSPKVNSPTSISPIKVAAILSNYLKQNDAAQLRYIAIFSTKDEAKEKFKTLNPVLTNNTLRIKVSIAHLTGPREDFLLMMEAISDHAPFKFLPLPENHHQLSTKAKFLNFPAIACNNSQLGKPRAYLCNIHPTVHGTTKTNLRFINMELHRAFTSKFNEIDIPESYTEFSKIIGISHKTINHPDIDPSLAAKPYNQIPSDEIDDYTNKDVRTYEMYIIYDTDNKLLNRIFNRISKSVETAKANGKSLFEAQSAFFLDIFNIQCAIKPFTSKTHDPHQDDTANWSNLQQIQVQTQIRFQHFYPQQRFKAINNIHHIDTLRQIIDYTDDIITAALKVASRDNPATIIIIIHPQANMAEKIIKEQSRYQNASAYLNFLVPQALRSSISLHYFPFEIGDSHSARKSQHDSLQVDTAETKSMIATIQARNLNEIQAQATKKRTVSISKQAQKFQRNQRRAQRWRQKPKISTPQPQPKRSREDIPQSINIDLDEQSIQSSIASIHQFTNYSGFAKMKAQHFYPELVQALPWLQVDYLMLKIDEFKGDIKLLTAEKLLEILSDTRNLTRNGYGTDEEMEVKETEDCKPPANK